MIDVAVGALVLSDATRQVAGVLLLTIVAVESGGAFLLRVARGRVAATPFQRAFFRAGHAHAGVLVTLALVCQLLVDGAELDGMGEWVARNGAPAAAILMSAGFFLSAVGQGRTHPTRLLGLVYLGGVCLAAGMVTLGIGLLSA